MTVDTPAPIQAHDDVDYRSRLNVAVAWAWDGHLKHDIKKERAATMAAILYEVKQADVLAQL